MSDIRANTISDASGNGPINLTGQSAAKAWINFDGTATTGTSSMTSVRGSLNISGVVDVTTGASDVSYTNNFANVNYATTIGSTAPYSLLFGQTNYTASTIRMNTRDASGNDTDAAIVAFMAVGDLA